MRGANAPPLPPGGPLGVALGLPAAVLAVGRSARVCHECAEYLRCVDHVETTPDAQTPWRHRLWAPMAAEEKKVLMQLGFVITCTIFLGGGVIYTPPESWTITHVYTVGWNGQAPCQHLQELTWCVPVPDHMIFLRHIGQPGRPLPPLPEGCLAQAPLYLSVPNEDAKPIPRQESEPTP